MPKRLVVCCDGTWSTPTRAVPTNVVHIARAILPTAPDGRTQVVFYGAGVGTGNWLDRVRGGVTGYGLDQNIEDAYRFLMLNYEEGDEIFLFGFSRGAYTARSLGGLIRNAGLLRKDHGRHIPAAFALYRRRDEASHPTRQEAREFRAAYSREVEIAFIGVWDTVGALGVPLRMLSWITRNRYTFHDHELSGIVRRACHAVAIDERRGPFRPTLWRQLPKEGQTVEQVWFAGVHSDVGGGTIDGGLPHVALEWMVQQAGACGLALSESYLRSEVRPDPMGAIHPSSSGIFRFLRPHRRAIGKSSPATESVHPAALVKHQAPTPTYAPDNLREYLGDPEHRVARVPAAEARPAVQS